MSPALDDSSVDLDGSSTKAGYNRTNAITETLTVYANVLFVVGGLTLTGLHGTASFRNQSAIDDLENNREAHIARLTHEIQNENAQAVVASSFEELTQQVIDGETTLVLTVDPALHLSKGKLKEQAELAFEDQLHKAEKEKTTSYRWAGLGLLFSIAGACGIRQSLLRDRGDQNTKPKTQTPGDGDSAPNPA